MKQAQKTAWAGPSFSSWEPYSMMVILEAADFSMFSYLGPRVLHAVNRSDTVSENPADIGRVECSRLTLVRPNTC